MLKRYSAFILVFILVILFISYVFIYDEDYNSTPKQVIADLKGTSFENLALPKDYNVRQFEGMTLRFIVENNRHATILLNESQEFSEITGINIKIKPVDFDTLVQKINLDFIAQAGQYQIVYVDPYQTLNRFYDYLEILNPYNQNAQMPRLLGFMDDFFEYQTEAISYFENSEDVYTIPFDSTTLIMFYRKDIFEKYAAQFYQEKGYDWTPGTKDFTWERYIEAARWINENVSSSEVSFGSGAMAQEHNSIFCEFANILAAYGGDFFHDAHINTLGRKSFETIGVLDESFIKALDVYKDMVSVSAPESVNWNWTDSANAFRNGEIAMMLNWDENYPYLNDSVYSKVAGNVGCAILPFGDVRSANIFGGSGIGINKYASEEEKHAAWLYIVWATSKQMQLDMLVNPEGGNLPTRMSVYEEPGIKQAISGKDSHTNSKETLNNELISTVLTAWKPEHLYLRPKISNFYQVEKILIKHLHDFVMKDMESIDVSQSIYDDLIKLNKKDEGGPP